MPVADILLPTCNRIESLIMALTGVSGQTLGNVHLVLADQSDQSVDKSPVVRTLLRIIESRGGETEYHHRIPSKGITEQRQFLLERASTNNVLYLDDDVLMEPGVLQRMIDTIEAEKCGFVGAFPAGLSFLGDFRPGQQRIEYWNGPVAPETVEPDTDRWELWHLHRAANLYHASSRLPPGEVRRYRVTWIASCVLYDRQKLLEVGGFSFWPRLPRFHSGEEVLVQNLLMRRWGGCALAPSGTYYAELPSTVLNQEGTVDGHALELLPEMISRYAPGP